MSQQINLFNPVFRQQKKHLSAVTMVQTLALVLAGALAMAGYVGYRTERVKAQAAAASAELTAAQNQLKQIEAEFAPRGKNPQIADQIRRVEAELRSLQQVAAILQQGEFGTTGGYAEYLRAFGRQIVDGVWLTGFTIAAGGTEIGLQGRAAKSQLLPLYIQRLRNEPSMQGKSFGALQMQLPQSPASGESSGVPYLEWSLTSSETDVGNSEGRGR